MEDYNKNVAYGFIGIFIINILNLIIPYLIFVGLTGIIDFDYYLAYQYYVVDATSLPMIAEDTYSIIMTVVIIAIFLWMFKNLKEIELDVLGSTEHHDKSRKYYLYIYAITILSAYSGAIMLILMYATMFFFVFIMLYLAIGGLIGIFYFVNFLYQLGKEMESDLIKWGAIIFVIGPILVSMTYLTTFLPLEVFGLSESLSTYIFTGILGSIGGLILGIGFYKQNDTAGFVRSERPRPTTPDYSSSPSYRAPQQAPPRQEPSIPFNSSPPPSSSPITRCPNCGTQRRPDDAFCVNCGRYLDG